MKGHLLAKERDRPLTLVKISSNPERLLLRMCISRPTGFGVERLSERRFPKLTTGSKWPNPEIRGRIEHRDPWLNAELP